MKIGQVFVKPTGINTTTNTFILIIMDLIMVIKLCIQPQLVLGQLYQQLSTGLSTSTGITTTSNFYHILKSK